MRSVVILRPVPEGYQVTIQPPLPDGHDRTRTYADRVGAWTYAQGLWTDFKLGCRDETRIAVTSAKERGPYKKRPAYIREG